jgi:RHS repeat-associated protein
MDNTQRIALARLGAAHPGDRGTAVQFNLNDHFGSSNVVLDSSGALVNREEFTPYGETCFGSFARKRYRFTRKERDEESGFGYHGLRYFALWTCRWASVDPQAAAFASQSPFSYSFNNPIRFQDPNGDAPNDSISTEELVVKVGEYQRQVEGLQKDYATLYKEYTAVMTGEHLEGSPKDRLDNLESYKHDFNKLHKRLSSTMREYEPLVSELESRPNQAIYRPEYVAGEKFATEESKLRANIHKTIGKIENQIEAVKFTNPSIRGGDGGGRSGGGSGTGGWGAISMAMIGIGMASLDVLNERNYVKATGKTGTSLMSLKAGIGLAAAVAVAWGALEHSEDHFIQREGQFAGAYVEDLAKRHLGESAPARASARSIGAGVTAYAIGSLSTAAAAVDMAKAGFKTTALGMGIQAYDYLFGD